MNKYTKLISILICTLFSVHALRAQSQDSTTVTSNKNLRFSIMGGPGYTPDYGFLIGGASLFTFSMDPKDANLQRSVVPLSFGLTFAKPIGINVMIKPQLFFKKDRIRLFGSFIFKNINENYYGVGYGTNKHTERSEATTQYSNSSYIINPILMFRLKDTPFYVGPMVDYIHERITNPGTFLSNDPLYQSQGGDSTGIMLQSVGIGATLSYDTRDVAANAYKGIYFEFKAAYYPTFFGSDFEFGSISFDYRQYKALPRLGERRVLTWNVASKNIFGDAPFSRYPLVGSPFDLRGYYVGQYRNRSTLFGLAEYRHMFNFGRETRTRRFFSRFGFAAWAGMGAMGGNPVKYEAVLPNFGAGLRIELQPRMNFRLDIGHSPIDKQTLIYFNMTEAF